MFVYRDDIYKERDEQRKEKESQDRGDNPPYKSAFIDKPIEEAEIIIGKQRNGSIGTVKLDFHKELTKFVDKEDPYSKPPEITEFESMDSSSMVIDPPEGMTPPPEDDNNRPPQIPTDMPDMDINVDIPDIF